MCLLGQSKRIMKPTTVLLTLVFGAIMSAMVLAKPPQQLPLDSLANQPCTAHAVASYPKPQLIGGYTPQCDEHTGLYTPRQCHGSIGYCWCAHPLTNAKLSPSYRPWLQESAPNCDAIAQAALAKKQRGNN